jgi:hypothetical protein
MVNHVDLSASKASVLNTPTCFEGWSRYDRRAGHAQPG